MTIRCAICLPILLIIGPLTLGFLLLCEMATWIGWRWNDELVEVVCEPAKWALEGVTWK